MSKKPVFTYRCVVTVPLQNQNQIETSVINDLLVELTGAGFLSGAHYLSSTTVGNAPLISDGKMLCAPLSWNIVLHPHEGLHYLDTHYYSPFCQSLLLGEVEERNGLLIYNNILSAEWVFDVAGHNFPFPFFNFFVERVHKYVPNSIVMMEVACRHRDRYNCWWVDTKDLEGASHRPEVHNIMRNGRDINGEFPEDWEFPGILLTDNHVWHEQICHYMIPLVKEDSSEKERAEQVVFGDSPVWVRKRLMGGFGDTYELFTVEAGKPLPGDRKIKLFDVFHIERSYLPNSAANTYFDALVKKILHEGPAEKARQDWENVLY